MHKNASVPEQRPPRSLRLRLMLWYGALLTVALGSFVALVMVIVTNSINRSVDEAVRAEARITTLAGQHKLSPYAPYWPSRLLLPTIDTYRDPGAAVEILDAQGTIRYYSASDTATSIPASSATIQTVLSGQSLWYTTTIGREHVRVEGLPVYAPRVDEFGDLINATINDDGTLSDGGPIIGVLLVAKSLSDVDRTLFLFQTLVLITGLTTLASTLAVSWVLSTRVLHPLSGIVITARAIVASTARGTRLGNLSQRMPRFGGRDEMALVVDTLNEMLASLESATEAQRRFIADASHELRAPLTTIRGNLAFFLRHLEELPADERLKILVDAHGETLRLTKLVDDLLLLARSDAHVEPLPGALESEGNAKGVSHRVSPIELDHSLLQLVRQLRGRLSIEDSKVSLEIGRIEPVRVRGDEESLRRVVLILLDNALKYTSESDEADPGRVTVSLEQLGGQALLRVRDTGIGIEPVDLPHIFERFYRADRARSRQGTGLGLSIAETEVEQLGGHITVESALGKGSTFSVWLPLA